MSTQAAFLAIMSASLPGESAEQQGGAKTQNDLYNQAFGEGSDLSELSDSEDERPRPRLPFPPRGSRRSPSGSATPEYRNDEDEDRDDDDVYLPGTTSNAARIPKFKKVSRNEGEAHQNEERTKSRPKKKRVSSGRRRVERREVAEEEEAAPVYDDETRELTAQRPALQRCH